MKAWYKKGDTVYLSRNINIFGVKAKYNKTPLTVKEVMLGKNVFYLLEIETKSGMREVELSQSSIISPSSKKLADEQDKIIKLLLNQKPPE